MNLLYTDIERTKEELSNVFNVKFEVGDIGLDQSELQLINTLKTDSHSRKQIRAINILEGPYGMEGYIVPKNEFERLLQKMMAIPQRGPVASELKKIVREVIIDHKCHKGKLNTIYRDLLIYRLTTIKSFSQALDRKFKVDRSYTSEEILLAFKELAELKSFTAFSDIIAKDIRQEKAVELFNKIYSTERSSRTVEGMPKTDAYKIYKKNMHFQPKV